MRSSPQEVARCLSFSDPSVERYFNAVHRAVQLLQLQMAVDLRNNYAAMAQEFLCLVQGDTILHKPAFECVPETVEM